MTQDLLQRAAKLNKIHKRRSRVRLASRLLALIIVFATVYALMMPAVTLNGDVICGFEEHTHSDECYEQQPVLICEKEESEAHTHTDACYTTEEGYICGLEESEGHKHTEACYTETQVLSCTLEESEGHAHSDECYGRGNLICVLEESDTHTHDDSCYERILTCGLEESEGHRHSESCYTTEQVLSCSLEETEAHEHTEACLGPVKVLSCDLEETEGHTHTEDCYEMQSVLVCGKEEHTHTDECYPEASDDAADVETSEIWEATFADVTLTGDYATDVLAIASTQLGYTESTRNFRYEGSEKKGYTRYGAWYGETYGDWCAMFVSFCLRYANVPETVIPSSCGCSNWAVLLDEMGRFASAEEFTPRPGDVIFFDTDGEGGVVSTHVGLVTEVTDTSVKTIEGNNGLSVACFEYPVDSAVILGYGLLSEPEDKSELEYSDDKLIARLTVSPSLPEDTELIIEQIDPAKEQRQWKNMAVPVLDEMLKDSDNSEENAENCSDEAESLNEAGSEENTEAENETGSEELSAPADESSAEETSETSETDSEEPSEPAAEADAEDISENENDAEPEDPADSEENETPNALQLYTVRLISEGKELELDESYNITLTVNLNAPVMDEEILRSSGSLVFYSLGLDNEDDMESAQSSVEADENPTESELLCESLLMNMSVEKESLQSSENSISDQEENTEAEEEKPLPALVAVKLDSIVPDEYAPVETGIESDGALRGFALMAMPQSAAPMPMMMLLGATPDSGTTETDISYHKQIEYLGSATDATDEEKISYRLYLDAGQYVKESEEASAPAFNGLVITDTLSDYVNMAGTITVTVKASGDATATKLYSRSTASADFEDKATGTDCTVFDTTILQSVKYDAATKTITVTFNPSAELDPTSQYTLSFNVKTNEATALKYKMSGYNATGDADTDYGTNATSAGQQGFYSNESATLSYTLGTEAKTATYPKPVVQAVEATSGQSTGYTAQGYITQNKTIDWLGDLDGNADTGLDDSAKEEDMQDFYRLYLDAGQYAMSEPVDLLIVLDKSNSMQSDDSKYKDVTDSKGNTVNRYVVMDEIINGVNGEDGLIEKFLAMNENNQYAVISFDGDDYSSGSIKSSMTQSYTKDTALESGTTAENSWKKTYTNITCKPDGTYGTNYCAALYRASDVLAASTSGNKQLMVFISDGVPTFWMDDNKTRWGTGSETGNSGSYTDDAYYGNTKTTTKTRNEEQTTARIKELKADFPNLGIYCIGIAGNDSEGKSKLETTLLNELASDGASGVYLGNNYQGLMTTFENIIFGNSGDFKALTITDTLSQYVDIYASDADIKVTLTEKNGSPVTLYEREKLTEDEVTKGFTDTATAAGATGNFTAANKDGSNPILQKVSYDPATKTITATFNPNVTLTKTSKHELSFNVKTTDAANDAYSANSADGGDPYGGVTGDNNTDYKTQNADDDKTSSAKSGFYSNTSASVSYNLGTTPYAVPYDHPVVQARDVDPDTITLNVTKTWADGAAKKPVTVKLYRTTSGGDELSPVMDGADTPAQISVTLNEANSWTAEITGLDVNDENDVRYDYYIVEDHLDGYTAEYTSPVTGLTINGEAEKVAGKVTVSDTATNKVYAATASVKNNPGIILPDTGGEGAVIYAVSGLLLFMLGSGLLMIKRRGSDEKRKMYIKGKSFMKKVLVLVMAALMVFSMGISAFAADDGSITISNATIDQTYTLYKVFDATIDTGNTPVSVAYTYSGTLPENDYFEQDSAGNIKIKAAGKDANGYLTSGAITFLGTIKGEAVKSIKATTNVVVFNSLSYGYYYVESSLNTLGNKAVAIDSTTPSAVLIDKNQGPTWYDPEGDEKDPLSENWLGKWIVLTDGSKVKKNSVNFGDTVSFEVSFNATNYVGEKQVRTYYLNDTIADGFDIDASSIKVYLDGTVLATTAWSVKWNTAKKSFTVTIPWDDADGKPLHDANTIIKVTYDATLLKNAVIASTGNVNTAWFDYRLDTDTVADTANPDNPPVTAAGTPNPFHKSAEETTTTYTYAFGLTKIDGQDKKVLKGAEFTLKCGETVIKADATENTGVYEYNKNGTVTQFKTDDNGVLVIKGLAEGTYTLAEKVSPKGYNRALSSVNFTLSNDNVAEYTENHTTTFDSDGNVTTVAANIDNTKTVTTDYDTNVYALTFENERGVELPITGGMGTTLFYVIGGALVFGAVLLLITKKRMKSEK